jgi:ABC-type transport system involved in multi-copper enzyme maturation permease subunit
LNVIWQIARNAVRENMRRRIVYVTLLFALVLLATVESLSRFEAQLQIKMVKDFSYTIISFFGLAITLLVTFDQVPQEIDSRTVYLILTRPVARKKFLLGKYLGILLVVFGILVMLGLILAALTAFLAPEQRIPVDVALVQGIYLLGLKYAVFAALLMLLSIALSRPLAVSVALLIYFYGHVSEAAQTQLVQSPLPFFRWIFGALEFVLPNFTTFDVSAGLIAQEIYSLQAVALLTAYALTFAFLYLLLANWLFATRDL